MFMEDLITKLVAVEYVFVGRDRKFIRSIGRRVEQNKALTTRQAWALLAILRKNQVNADLGMKREVYLSYIADPQWRHPLVPSVELKNEVRHIGDNLLGFRTSNGKTEIEFAAMKAVYSHGMKVVTIDNKATLDAVIEFIGKWRFEMDYATEEFLADCMARIDQWPRAILDGDQILIDVPNQIVLSQFVLHVLGADFL